MLPSSVVTSHFLCPSGTNNYNFTRSILSDLTVRCASTSEQTTVLGLSVGVVLSYILGIGTASAVIFLFHLCIIVKRRSGL